MKYTNIDKHSDWYDLVSKDVASEEDQLKIKQLPDHLKPNMARFSFIFFPDTSFDTKSYQSECLSMFVYFTISPKT
ncbi:DUF4747 family protein, partial [Vibrio parahaemolyticus]|uniref:DUF4747 family protein n=1 Tax=Vibrio parahaemolyticus TaxID=670 RepID=UPI00147D3358